MEYKPEQLDELFKLPVGLKPVVKLDGKTLYGSDDLNSSFLDAIQSTSLIGNTDIFYKLVKSGKIVPCFLTGGLTSFIFWKIFAPVHLKSVVGFFSRETKKIYILLSNNYNFFAYTSNDWLAKLVIHETVHMLSDVKPTIFVDDFKDILMKYYSYYLNRVFSKEINENDVMKYITFLYNGWERGLIKDNNLLEYKNTLRTITKDEKLIEKIIIIINVYFSHFDKFYQVRPQFYDVLYPLYMAYKNGLNIKNLSTVAIQELFYPSEVVAIASEYSQYSGKVLSSLKRLT